jgi:polyhydroxyalkanoate synthesis repressor PhaR
VIVKKYGNRRLYDTEGSRYITLEELAEKIRAGADARVVDAKTGEDLTQVTLTQIIIEGRGAARMLAIPLLTQLVRMGDDSLAEFFGRYVTWALEIYLQTKQSARSLGPLNPFSALSGNPFLRGMMGGMSPWGEMAPPPMPAPVPEPPPPAPAPSEVAMLRKELEAMKRSMRRGRKK